MAGLENSPEKLKKNIYLAFTLKSHISVNRGATLILGPSYHESISLFVYRWGGEYTDTQGIYLRVLVQERLLLCASNLIPSLHALRCLSCHGSERKSCLTTFTTSTSVASRPLQPLGDKPTLFFLLSGALCCCLTTKINICFSYSVFLIVQK